jgi:glycogen synthase
MGYCCETVLDASSSLAGRTGFLFRRASIEPFLRAIGRALHTFGDKTQLNSMRQAAMQRVFGWKEPSQNYLSVYSRARKTA